MVIKKANLGTFDEFVKDIMNGLGQAGTQAGKQSGTGSPQVKFYPGGAASIAFPSGPQYVSGGPLKLMHKGYQTRKINGDPNDKSKIEAVQCERCKKWIPVIALMDYEDGFSKDKILDCPIGRTGNGGIHMFAFGDPDNPSITTTMMPLSQVEPYTSPNPKTKTDEPKNVPDTPAITAENFEEEIRKLKEIIEKKGKKGTTDE